MKTTKKQKAIHRDAIARWFARRRKTTSQKVLLDLEIIPPSTHPEDVFGVYRRRSPAPKSSVAGRVRAMWWRCVGISDQQRRRYDWKRV